MNYFSQFKRMVKAAFKQGYFHTNPAEEIKGRKGKAGKLKANLEVEDYLALLKTPCLNEEVREAFIQTLESNFKSGLKTLRVKTTIVGYINSYLIKASLPKFKRRYFIWAFGKVVYTRTWTAFQKTLRIGLS